MKKIFLALAAMAMVFASCNKEEFSDNSGSVSVDFQVNVTVADLGTDSPATRAKIKSGWTSGDQISIWYDSNNGAYPDLVIEYNGSKWDKKTEGVTLSGKEPSEGSGKYLKALYNGQLKVASKDDYSFINNTLTINIQNWTFLTEIQVVVTGISSSDATNYTLACDHFTPLSGYEVGTDAITATTGTKGAPTTGIANTDGAAFVFATSDYDSDNEQNFLFTLTNTTDDLGTRKVKGYSINKTLAEGTTQIKAIKLSGTDFRESVKLWAEGPEWAYGNIGASSATDGGCYFAWGYTQGYVRNGSSWVKADDSSSSINFDDSGFPDYASHTYSDMAAAYWGTDWKVPDPDEFKTLINEDSSNKCTVEYVTTGIKGIKITGIGEFSAKSIFLPAAGYGYGSSLENAGNGGFYWSSTQFSSDYANGLFFFPDGDHSGEGHGYKYCGYPVRPVKNAAPATTGTAKAKLDGTNEVDVTWVQLWAGGPKWATINVGATDPSATTNYGSYYTWGGSRKQAAGDYSNDYNDGSDDLSGDTDTATKLWGSNWRMPTSTELTHLIDKCSWSHQSNGNRITGKDAYDSNQIFLPNTGYLMYFSDSSAAQLFTNQGFYWASTLADGNGEYLCIDSNGSPSVTSYTRSYGSCIRPVLVEVE